MDHEEVVHAVDGPDGEQASFSLSRTRLTQLGFSWGRSRSVSLKSLGKAFRSRSKTMPQVSIFKYGILQYKVYVKPKKTVLYIGCVKFTGSNARRIREAALLASR